MSTPPRLIPAMFRTPTRLRVVSRRWPFIRSFASSPPSFDRPPPIQVPRSVQEWIDSSSQICSYEEDVVDLNRVKGMAATLPTAEVGELDGIGNGSPLREGWHLCLFQPILPTSNLRTDGLNDGVFAPPAPFTQRMWVSGSFAFNPSNPLIVGQPVTMSTVIEKVEAKKGGKTGDMVLTWKGVEVGNEKGWSVREKRCDMFRKEGGRKLAGKPEMTATKDSSRPPSPAPTSSDFSFSFRPSKIDLFRFSALTFNSHRIHYDSEYAREVEGYPDCLVHGPLTALLLLEVLSRKGLPQLASPKASVESFSYRATSPLVVGSRIDYRGKWSEDDKRGPCELWAVAEDGTVGMKGEAILRH